MKSIRNVILSKVSAINADQRGVAFVEWLVVAILAAALVPSIMTTLLAVDTTTWGTMPALIWDNLPVFLIIGVLYIFLKKTGISVGK